MILFFEIIFGLFFAAFLSGVGFHSRRFLIVANGVGYHSGDAFGYDLLAVDIPNLESRAFAVFFIFSTL